MITYVIGDLFQSPAKVLVNTVNTVGVMGSGIAKDFRRIYPDMFKQYQQFCERGQFNVGQLWIYKTSHKWILNFPTKAHWRHKSRPEYIEQGLKKFVETYAEKGITSISFPRLGCGNGELDWATQVRPLMEGYLKNLPIDVYIHLYEKDDLFAPEHRNIKEVEAWLRGEPQILAFTEFWHDLEALTTGQTTFATLDNGQPFSVSIGSIDQENSGVFIRVKGAEEIVIAQDSFADLWQHFRSAGFIMAKNLPGDFQQHPQIVVSLLAQLGYVRPVRLSDTTDEKPETGLQLVPLLADQPVAPSPILKVEKLA